jgi:hypothetical protein
MSIGAPSTLVTHPIHVMSVVKAFPVDKDCGNMVVGTQLKEHVLAHSCASTVEKASQAARVISFTLVSTLGNVLSVAATVGRLFVMVELFVNMNVFTQVNGLTSVHFVSEHLIKKWYYVNMYAGYMQRGTQTAVSYVGT